MEDEEEEIKYYTKMAEEQAEYDRSVDEEVSLHFVSFLPSGGKWPEGRYQL